MNDVENKLLLIFSCQVLSQSNVAAGKQYMVLNSEHSPKAIDSVILQLIKQSHCAAFRYHFLVQ